MQSNRTWISQTPLVIAHRGASAYAPENTMSAFHAAVEMGADAIELDAKLTKDGEIVVIHDATLERTTNGEGTVHQTNLEEIRILNASIAFGSDFAGEKVPLLSEVLEAFHHQVLINIELTNYLSPTDRLPVEVAKLIRGRGLSSRILLSSFNPLNLIRSHSLLPGIPFALLLDAKTPALVRRLLSLILRYEFLHPHVSMTDKGLVNRLHRNGKGINVWTVNDEKQISTLFHMGVDGIITDHPDIALNVIKRGIRSEANPSRSVYG